MMIERTPIHAIRPRRSALYVPGANERAIQKSGTLAADALIFDLENSVAPGAKIEARRRVCAAVASGQFRGRDVVIRVNGLGTPWHADDLRAACEARPDAILLPKVKSAADVPAFERELNALGANQALQIWLMLETASAIPHAEEIAHCSPRASVLVMGTNDLAAELHAEHVPGRHPLWLALSTGVLAARGAGKMILDGVYNDIADPSGFEAECIQARQMGFDGKTLVHPSQIEPCHRVFTPTAADVERARATIAAFEQAEADGRAVVVVEGRMVENLHVEAARRTVALSQAISEMNR